MLRDRYRKWGINDKNARPRQVAVAKRRITTQTALLHSPRIEELNDDGSHIAQEPVSTQDEHELLGLRMVLSGLRPGSPRAALLTLDSRIHEILNGLSYWCNSTLPSFRDPILTPSSIRSADLKKSFLKNSLGHHCHMAAMIRLRSRNLWGVLETILLFSEYQSRDWIDWLEGRPFEQCRILWSCCEFAAQGLGPQHPVTLIWIWTARGLPFEDLASISKGIFRIHAGQPRPLPGRGYKWPSVEPELRFNTYLQWAIDTQELRLRAVAARSASYM
jgi:hypothetical protein